MRSETLYVEITKKGNKPEFMSLQVWNADLKMQSLQNQFIKDGATVRRIDKQAYIDGRNSK